ncbi:MAG: ABC transporter permease, partial [Candidatus Izemoplasmatales bacterium]|nr:ABC transporter permease [Candidatus Izemoplasmatales bacterium]
MKNILTIFKKEWDRVIKDRRLILSVMILPGLMIFMIYTFIGMALDNTINQAIVNVAIVNPTAAFSQIYQAGETTDNLNVITITADQVADYEAQIDAETFELLIIFSDNFETYDGTGDKPTVTLYGNSNSMNGSAVYSRFAGYVSAYQTALSTTYFTTVWSGTPVDPNVQTGSMISSMLPMLVVMFLFSGALSIGPESIAGEKERNTISTLLITPVKRSEIALGKILSLSV